MAQSSEIGQYRHDFVPRDLSLLGRVAGFLNQPAGRETVMAKARFVCKKGARFKVLKGGKLKIAGSCKRKAKRRSR